MTNLRELREILCVVVLFVAFKPGQGQTSSNVNTFFSAIQRVSTSITDVIPDWYEYDYDGDDLTSIGDGGIDMFDDGNRIRFYEDEGEIFTHLTYDDILKFQQVEYGTSAGHPFLALAWIKNLENEKHNYSMEVTGEAGADGRGNISVESGSFSRKGLRTSYHVFQIYDARDPSIVNLHFTVESETLWNSQPGSFELVSYSQSTTYANSSVRLSGDPKNLLMGFMLLSRRPERLLNSSLVEQVLTIVLDSLADLGSFTPVRLSDCGLASLTAEEDCIKVLESPGYPNPADTDCVWRITAAAGYYIRFNLTTVENDESITLFERPNSPSELPGLDDSIYYSRGNLYPPLLTTRNNQIYLLHHKVFATSNNPFRLTYHSVAPSGDVVTKHLDAFSKITQTIIGLVPSWFNYPYTDFSPPLNSLVKGRVDGIFQDGNKVQFSIDGNITNSPLITYGDIYRTGPVQFISAMTHPFVSLMWIDNNSTEMHDYMLRVSGTYEGPALVFENQSGIIMQSGFTAVYHAHQESSFRPSDSKLIFYIESETLWDSVPGTFAVVSATGLNSRNYDSTVRLSGRPRNVLMGYMLLSRSVYSSIVPASVIDEIMRTLVNAMPRDVTVFNSTEEKPFKQCNGAVGLSIIFKTSTGLTIAWIAMVYLMQIM
ncbi:uncharacterized protein LOC143457341 [Clavelina lepadiformis]|uniref:uncharacterized protein LOC143457341 n=1 Tax=Clavelina lepadiformis TaxID=159417 RepID=UPI00404203B4